MRRFCLFSVVAAVALCSRAVHGETLAEAAGEHAQVYRGAGGAVRLAVRMDLPVQGDSADPFEALFSRFPADLPRPEGLEPRTREWTFGPIRVVQRTWSWQGVPVDGLSMTLHLDPAGHVRVISAPGLGFGPERATEPGVSRREAEARARAVVLEGLGVEPTWVGADLHVRAARSGLTSVWRVGVWLPPFWPPVFVEVDGRSGAVVSVFPAAVEGVAGADGTTGWGNVFEDSYLDGDTVEVLLEDLNGSGTLTGSYVNVWQYTPGNPPTNLSQTAGDLVSGAWHFDFDPIEEYTGTGPTTATQTDAFAEVMMYYHVDRVHDFFNDLGYFNDDPLAGIDRSMQATVNYRGMYGYYDNAYYAFPSGLTPGQMVFGQGEATDFSYDSSIIYHEYGHAVINGSSNYAFYCVNDVYGSDCTQGGLNEGTADYFSAALRGDPVIGRYSLGEWLPAYVRDLTDPHRCPDDLYGEEHEDGKVWGGGLWDVRLAVAGTDVAAANATIDPVILAAVTTPLAGDTGATSAFSLVASILLSDAEAAFGTGTAVTRAIESALMARGLLSCSRFVPLKTGEVKEGAFSTATRPGRESVTVAGLQYLVDVPESAVSFTFGVSSDSGLEKLTIYLRKDAPIEFSFNGNTLSQVTADYQVEGTILTLDAGTTPPLEPGHTYYLTFSSPQTLSTALWGHYYSVQATVGGTFNPGENTATGCGCNLEHSSKIPAGSGAFLLVVTGMVAHLRRRTRS